MIDPITEYILNEDAADKIAFGMDMAKYGTGVLVGAGIIGGLMVAYNHIKAAKKRNRIVLEHCKKKCSNNNCIEQCKKLYWKEKNDLTNKQNKIKKEIKSKRAHGK